MNQKSKMCLVSCSVLKRELQELVRQGKLDADLVFVSKNFHVDYALVEQNVRKVLKATLKRYPERVILVYGDLCLGPNNEMNALAAEYAVAKVDALNCVDCQLGGKGKSLEADPDHNLMFMGPGMIDFFRGMKETLRKQGMDDAAFAAMFSGIKGFILLDTLGNTEEEKRALEKEDIGLAILETWPVGLENIQHCVQEAIDQCCAKEAKATM